LKTLDQLQQESKERHKDNKGGVPSFEKIISRNYTPAKKKLIPYSKINWNTKDLHEMRRIILRVFKFYEIKK